MSDYSIETNYDHRSNASFSDYAFTALLFAPLFLYYFLPSTLEARISVRLWGGGIFLPELLFLIAPCFYKRTSSFGNSKLRQLLIIACAVCFLSSFSLFIRPGIDSPQSRIVMSAEAFLFPLLALMFPFTERHEKPLRLILLLCVSLFGLQIFLYSLGFLKWKVELGDDGFGEVTRINTTIGAATGSGMVLFMLGSWSAELWRNRKWVFLVTIFISIVSILMLLSRGSILMVLVIASLVVMRRAYTYRFRIFENLKLLAVVILLLIAVGFVGTKYGVFESVSQRLTQMDNLGEDGRIVRYRNALETAVENPIAGVGPSCYFVTKRFKSGALTGMGAPHNYYLTILVEYGFPLALFFITCLIMSVVYVWYRMPLSITAVGLLTVAMIGMNVEGIFIEVEFGFLFFMILSSMIYHSGERVYWRGGLSSDVS